jgi:hypothetical protein
VIIEAIIRLITLNKSNIAKIIGDCDGCVDDRQDKRDKVCCGERVSVVR